MTFSQSVHFTKTQQSDATRKERPMNTLRRKLYFGLAILALAAASLGLGADRDATARKVNEYEGQHFAKKGSFDITEAEGQARKVNEYEGQHRSISGDPSQWG